MHRSERHCGITGLMRCTMLIAFVLIFWQMASTAGCSRPRQQFEEVRASRFVLVDDAGQERGDLAVTSDGAARLRIEGAANDLSVWVGVNENGPSVAILDEAGKVAVEMTVFKGDRIIALRDSERIRVGLRAWQNGSATVTLWDQSGKKRAQLESADEVAGFVTFDPQGVVRGSFGVADPGLPSNVLYDEAGRPRLGLVFESDGSARLFVLDENGNTVGAFP